jgi:hypothetical protein
MRLGVGVAVGVALAFGLLASAAVAGVQSGWTAARPTECPTGVLVAVRSADEVLRGAESALSQKWVYTMHGRHHLDPRNAPISLIESIAIFSPASSYDSRVPGLVALHHYAAGLCGERTAQASWAVEYWLPTYSATGYTLGLTLYPFVVKTHTGWRFWGNWCGLTQSASFRAKMCG